MQAKGVTKWEIDRDWEREREGEKLIVVSLTYRWESQTFKNQTWFKSCSFSYKHTHTHTELFRKYSHRYCDKYGNIFLVVVPPYKFTLINIHLRQSSQRRANAPPKELSQTSSKQSIFAVSTNSLLHSLTLIDGLRPDVRPLAF